MISGKGRLGVRRSLRLREKVFDSGDFLFFLVHFDALRDAGATEVLTGAVGGEMRLDSVA